MKRLFLPLLVLLFLTSCTYNTQRNVKKIDVKDSIFFNKDNVYIEQAIERKKKKELEEWRAEHLLATATTIFDPMQIERTTNIKLAANFINGLVLNPGDEFSFNNIVGQRTLERGFLPADIYVSTASGEVVTVKSPGGGICQVSSTICMAVIQTSLNIVERNTHSANVAYASPEQEAMINWGTSDFRFVNNYEFPIKIEILFIENIEGEEIICNIFYL